MTELFDPEGILDRVCHDQELLSDLIEMLKEDCEVELLRLQEAVRQSDLPTAQTAIHKLKNAIGNFSAGPAFRVIQSFESAALAGDLSGGTTFLRDLEGEIVKLLPALDRFLSDLQGGKPSINTV